MTDFNPLTWRRKTLATAFFAAAGSFSLGVLVPMNFRISSLLGLMSSSSILSEKPLPKVMMVKTAISQQVMRSQSDIRRMEQRFQVLLPSRFQGSILSQVNLPSQKKVIALTFDDGPWPNSTVKILEILEKNKIKATFFWVGRYLQAHGSIGKKVVNAGHAIGNHSWSHQYIKYSPERASQEIDKTTELIEKQTGVSVSLFRPPGGMMNNGLVAHAQKKNYAVIMWSADSLDWRVSSQSLIDNVLNQASSGGIVLMHDGGGNRSKTVGALPTIITQLKKQGYEFVTVPELLAIQDQELLAKETKKGDSATKKSDSIQETKPEEKPGNPPDQQLKNE